MTEISSQDHQEKSVYQVLARKYRSQNFAELIGQDALVRTLTNAIESGRVHHAYMFTGVRGTGKTSTARIVAKSLNCLGADGKGGPTPTPCGICENCKAITADRHVDVIEMDAASHTGVDDMRDIIDSARYAPVNARYKVYIIDEVHMLSKSAFNALLKTLEEPPPHIVFIFATTEIRKVPTTILSRCQRFDLKRVEIPVLSAHYKKIAESEGVTIDDEALNLIARAADGSVRDGLSLLDQAISQSGGTITVETVQAMLGQVDGARIYDLFKTMMEGNGEGVIDILELLYQNGAGADIILQDLLETVHLVTRLKVTPSLAESEEIGMIERTQGKELAEKLSMPVLTRAWQMLLKGVTELQSAPMPMKALEMVLIRLIYAGMLPTPEEVVSSQASSSSNAQAPAQKKTPDNASPISTHVPMSAPSPAVARAGQAQAKPQAQPEAAPEPVAQKQNNSAVNDFTGVVHLMRNKGETLMASECALYISPVSMREGQLELHPLPGTPKDLISRIGRFLNENTGTRWMVSVVREKGGPTIKEMEEAEQTETLAAVKNLPDVKKLLEKLPSHTIMGVSDTNNSKL